MTIHLQGSFVITQEDCAGEPTQAIATLKRLDPLVTSRLPFYRIIFRMHWFYRRWLVHCNTITAISTLVLDLFDLLCNVHTRREIKRDIIHYYKRNKGTKSVLLVKLVMKIWRNEGTGLLYAHMKCIGLFYISPPGKQKRKERLYSGVYGVIVAWLATINDKLQCWYRLQERPR